MLGTLYVIAPGALVKHGDSERGLELLEGLVSEHPEIVENHLRLAEAYIALGDPDPAGPSCACASRIAASCGATTNSCSTSWWQRRAAPSCDEPS